MCSIAMHQLETEYHYTAAAISTPNNDAMHAPTSLNQPMRLPVQTGKQRAPTDHHAGLEQRSAHKTYEISYAPYHTNAKKATVAMLAQTSLPQLAFHLLYYGARNIKLLTSHTSVHVQDIIDCAFKMAGGIIACRDEALIRCTI
jgi:hypothetical protein